MELPQYTLKPSVNRMVAPWILKLLGLAVLFYFGIYFNVKFAMKMDIPSYINILIFVFLIVLVVTQVILYNIRFGKYNYKFYTNRVEFEGKKPATFLFSGFQQAEVKQGIFDKAFGTGIIKLSKSFSIGPISNVRQIESYLEQLVKYYRYTQERFRAQQQQASMQQEMAGRQQVQQQYSQQAAQAQQSPQQGAQGSQYRGV